MKNINLQQKIICAIFAALTAVLSQVIIPIGVVPINLGMLSVFIVGGVLTANMAALSQIIFVLVGATGIPVFAGFKGGVGALTGPTGGYIFGYIAAAWLTAFIITKCNNKHAIYTVLAMLVGLIVCYTMGTAWFMYSTKNSIAKSLMLCVVPFLIGDAVKIVLATIISRRLRKVKQLKLQ